MMKTCASPLLLPLAVAAALTATACGLPEYEPGTMDDPEVLDPVLTDDSYLLSTRYPEPTTAQRQAPVIIAAHGFGASTFEWVEYRDHAQARGALVSLVLLGGHGRSTEAWVETRWQDWGAPILDEYEALSDMGYTNISLFSSSTGCTLALEHFAEGRFDDLTPLNQLVMVAPFIRPQNDLLYQSRFVGPFIGNLPTAYTQREKEMFYTNRPATLFNDLSDLIVHVENLLAEGIDIAPSTGAHIFRADSEGTVAPESADLIIDGVDADGPVTLTQYASEHHIFTRKAGRAATSELSDEQLEAGVVGFEPEDEVVYDAAFAAFDALLDLTVADR